MTSLKFYLDSFLWQPIFARLYFRLWGPFPQ